MTFRIPSSDELDAIAGSGATVVIAACEALVNGFVAELSGIGPLDESDNATRLQSLVQEFASVGAHSWRTRAKLVTPIGAALARDTKPLERTIDILHASEDRRLLGEGGVTYLDDRWPGDLADAIFALTTMYPLRLDQRRAFSDLAATMLRDRPARRRMQNTIEVALRFPPSAVQTVDQYVTSSSTDPELADFDEALGTHCIYVFVERAAFDTDEFVSGLRPRIRDWSDEQYDRFVTKVLDHPECTPAAIAKQRGKQQLFELLAEEGRITPASARLASFLDDVRPR